VARKRWLAKTLLYLILETGALLGVPIRLDQIEELTRIMNGAVVEEVVRREDDGGGDPPQ